MQTTAQCEFKRRAWKNYWKGKQTYLIIIFRPVNTDCRHAIHLIYILFIYIRMLTHYPVTKILNDPNLDSLKM